MTQSTHMTKWRVPFNRLSCLSHHLAGQSRLEYSQKGDVTRPGHTLGEHGSQTRTPALVSPFVLLVLDFDPIVTSTPPPRCTDYSPQARARRWVCQVSAMNIPPIAMQARELLKPQSPK